MGAKVVADKHRGSVVYFHVMALLIKAAEAGKTVTYQQVADIMRLPPTGNHTGKETGHLLGEISEDEHLRGRPFLSAVAINNEAVPGSGFEKLTLAVGKMQHNDDYRKFWKEELHAVFEVWQGR
jgi:hypothetical protein